MLKITVSLSVKPILPSVSRIVSNASNLALPEQSADTSLAHCRPAVGAFAGPLCSLPPARPGQVSQGGWNRLPAPYLETDSLLVGCLTSQQHASVSQGRICTDNFTCCHTEIEAADQTFHLTQSQYTDTGPTSPSADPITPGAWQGSHWSANF